MKYVKWNRKTYNELRKSINRFNKKIRILSDYELDFELPEEVNYKQLKEDILTEKQLRQTLSSLRSFNKSTALDKVVLASGEVISKWEEKEINKKRKLAIERVKESLAQEIANETERTSFKGLTNERIDRLNQTLNTLENYNQKTGKQLRYAIDRIMKIGEKDYDLKKAITFRDNFMYALKEGASTFKNYKVLRRELNKIKNPMEFYDYLKNSDTFMDLFIWYKENSGLVYGGFVSNEEAFDSALEKDFNIKL